MGVHLTILQVAMNKPSAGRAKDYPSFLVMFFPRMRRKAPLVAAVACQVLLVGVQSSSACGLDWRLPTNHFDGVDSHGHISYWERIGEVDCGDGLNLPLQINFNSSRDAGASSPYLGQGWMLPLLESKFVQDSEDHFHMVQPDGYNNRFIRDKSDETVLNGSAGWKGQINGETITAWAACGWKIVFTKGRITSMTSPKGRQLDWVYEGGQVSELREGSSTRLKVEYGPDGRAAALALPEGKRIVITEEKKPQVQTIAGQNVIAGVVNSLGTLTLADGQKRNFVFATDEKMLPTLKVEGQSGGNRGVVASGAARLLSWNPQTKMAARDGDWTYQIAQNADPKSGDAAIGRTDTQGKKEYWFKDKTNGQETTQGIDGVKWTKYWFISGSLEHKLRKIEEVADGKKQVAYQAAYDDKGKLFRTMGLDSKMTLYKYDDKGNQTEKILDGQTLWKKSYDPKGRLTEESYVGGHHVVNKYLDDGSCERTITKANGSTLFETLRDGLIVKRKENNGSIEEYSYDSHGGLKQITDAHNTTWGFKRGKTGEVVETSKDGHLLYRIFTDASNEARIRVTYAPDGSPITAWNWIHDRTPNNIKDKGINPSWIPLL